MRYSLLAGGKRIRPVIALATTRTLGGEPELMLPFAAAVEMIHTYSLIHDDLPAMDDDDLRRGMPTLHRRSGEAVAILAGDCLYAEAFRLLLTSRAADGGRLAAAAAQLASATGVDGMVGGQFLDVQGSAVETVEALERLHALKTGRLIHASADCVSILMGVDGEEAKAIGAYASQLGLLFQIVDDILDVVGSDEDLGKPSGSDERQGKTTFVSLLGLEGARDEAERRHAAALSALGTMGSAATPLRAIADYVWTRTS